ncbi:hypothetical protein KL867_22020, partial [Ruegeria litorea]
MTTILLENFETDNNGISYTTSVPEFIGGTAGLPAGAADFFTRTNGSDVLSDDNPVEPYSLTGQEGSFYFAAADIDNVGRISDTQTLTFSNIGIATFTNLNLSVLVAEDDDDTSSTNEDWDSTDGLVIEYRIDGGSYNNLLSFQSEHIGADTSNNQPRQDTNFDGAGDGTILTDTFQNFSAAIGGTGNSLDIRFTFSFGAEDEDVAIDNIVLTGDSSNAAPTLDTNTGSSLNEGATDIITTSELETNDTDNTDAQLTYTLDATVVNGTLYLDNDGSNTFNAGDTTLSAASTFTQQDIADGDLQYVHDGGETTSDSFQFDVSDGAAPIINQTFNFTIAPVNDVPTITGFAGDSGSYNEILGGQALIEQGNDVSVADPDDANFNGGTLAVSFDSSTTEDQLTVDNGGNNAVGIARIEGFLFYNSALIGTVAGGATGGTNGSSLVFSFNNNIVTTTVVEELIEALRYGNSSVDDPTPGVRSINVVLNDGTGNSATSTATVNVTAVNDAPSVTLLPGD